MENDTENKTAGAEQASGKKFKMSELIAAFRNHDVELDSNDVVCCVTDDAACSFCNFDKLDLRTQGGFRKLLCHRGLSQIALEAMCGEPEAVGMLAEAGARDMRRKDASGLFKAMFGAGKD